MLLALGFGERIKGGHHIFHKELVPEIINLQPLRDGKAKPYQVKQVRNRPGSFPCRIGGRAPWSTPPSLGPFSAPRPRPPSVSPPFLIQHPVVVVAAAELELRVGMIDARADAVAVVKSNGVPATTRNSPVGIRPVSTGVKRAASMVSS